MAVKKFAKEADPTVAKLLDEGHKLQEEYADLIERRDNVRTSLRALVGAGMASKEQAQLADELYPPRKVKDKDETTTTTEDNAAQAA